MALNVVKSATVVTATTDSGLFPFPFSISPLPKDLKIGLAAPGTTGLLSTASCIGMLLFVIWRFITWRSHYKVFVGYNQYVVLIVNLLLADMMQGISFMFSFHWIAVDGILAPSLRCFGQGFLLNLGDLSSGFFVFGIALHTFHGAVYGSHAKHTTFSLLVVSAWLLALFLTALGPILHREDYFVRAGAWCWVSSEYETERLAFHYAWIFAVQFGTIILYTLIFLHLKRTLAYILPRGQSSTYAKVDRAARLMVLFPIAYIILTLPLSAGRMWTRSTGNNLPDAYALVAGSMIGSCGIVDCLLYTLTRRSLLKQNTQESSQGSHGSSNIEKGSKPLPMDVFGIAGITQTRTVTVTGDRLSMISDDSSSLRGSLYPSTLSRSATCLGTSVDSNSRSKYLSALSVHGLGTKESQERMFISGLEGLDPRKGEAKVEITATAVEVHADSIGEERGGVVPAESAGRSRRAESPRPYSVRSALGLFRGGSTRQ